MEPPAFEDEEQLREYNHELISIHDVLAGPGTMRGDGEPTLKLRAARSHAMFESVLMKQGLGRFIRAAHEVMPAESEPPTARLSILRAQQSRPAYAHLLEAPLTRGRLVVRLSLCTLAHV